MAAGPYTLENLIEDAAASSRRRASASRHAVAELAEVWAAIDRYASDCLECKRGLAVPNLCKFGWQVMRLRGKTTQRPYFQFADSFFRCCGVDPATIKGALPPPEKDLLPIEEFNFSKAAIRFSNELTKDQVSSGLRLLVRQLGEAVELGRSLAVELSFGKLMSRGRDDLNFAFAAHFYLAHDLDVPVGAADDIEYRPPPSFGAVPDTSVLESLKLKGSCVQTPQHSKPPSAPCSSRASGRNTASSWEYSRHRGADVLQLQETKCDTGSIAFGSQPSSAHGRSSSSRAPRLATGSTLRRASLTGGVDAVHQAREDAVNREISALEVRASEALRNRVEMTFADKIAAKDARDQAERRAQMIEHSEALKQQIEAKAHRRRADAVAAAEDIAAVGLPAAMRGETASTSQTDGGSECARAAGVGSGVASRSTARPPPLKLQVQREVALAISSGRLTADTGNTSNGGDKDPDNETCQNRSAARELRQALDAQIEAKQAHHRALRQFEQRLEANVVENGVREVETQRAMEQAARVREREILADAWQQQNKFKDIRQAIEAVEGGKRVPASKSALNDFAAVAMTSRPASEGNGFNFSGQSVATPRSARGAPLGAAASLALRGASVSSMEPP